MTRRDFVTTTSLATGATIAGVRLTPGLSQPPDDFLVHFLVFRNPALTKSYTWADAKRLYPRAAADWLNGCLRRQKARSEGRMLMETYEATVGMIVFPRAFRIEEA